MADDDGSGRQAGETLESGKYRLEKLLGSGSHAEVWLATDTADGSQVAIKLLHEHVMALRGVVARFMREMNAIRRLSKNQYVVAGLVFIRGPGYMGIVMEYIHGGETLRSRMGTHNASAHEALRVVSHILRALAAAHEIGLIHRDVKPENVLLNGSTSPETAMLADFGIARAAASDGGGTRIGTVMGTFWYMSLEQARGAHHTTLRSDIFSLGVMLAEIVGVRPLVSGYDDFDRLADETRRQTWLARIADPFIRAVVEIATRNEFIDGVVVPRRYESATAMLVAVEATMLAVPQGEIPWVKREERRQPDPHTIIKEISEEVPAVGHASEISSVVDVAAPTATSKKISSPPPRVGQRLGMMALVAAPIIVIIGMAINTFSNSEQSDVQEVTVAPEVAAPPAAPPPVPVAALPPEPATVPPPIAAAPSEEPKLEVQEVASVQKTEAPPAKKAEAKSKAPPKTAAPMVAETPKPETVSKVTVVITSHPTAVKVGERIEIAATISIPDGMTEKSRALFCRGAKKKEEEKEGPWQKRPLTDGATARGTIAALPAFGNRVDCYVGVWLVGGDEPIKSKPPATTTIE